MFKATKCLIMHHSFKVNELFTSLQGESSHAGAPCFFIRLTGCPLRCVWCDTEYAFYEGKNYQIKELIEEAKKSKCEYVEVTGGEPLAQKETIDLLKALLDENFKVLLETSGSFPIDNVPQKVIKIIDIKCPGSGMADRNIWENFVKLEEHDEIKCVIADENDYLWAKRELTERNLLDKKILFSPVKEILSPEKLANWILKDRLPVKLQLQMHKLIWPDKSKGY